jgi:adenosylcobyric acid synthase
MLRFADGRQDGAVSPDGKVAGCYVHGLFASDAQRASWLTRLGGTSAGYNYESGIDDVLDGFAAHLENHMDVERLLRMAR